MKSLGLNTTSQNKVKFKIGLSYSKNSKNYHYGPQGRREGVKGVAVSRGPDLKKGPENYEYKRKTKTLGP
jgi:hypothetical protein